MRFGKTITMLGVLGAIGWGIPQLSMAQSFSSWNFRSGGMAGGGRVIEGGGRVDREYRYDGTRIDHDYRGGGHVDHEYRPDGTHIDHDYSDGYHRDDYRGRYTYDTYQPYERNRPGRGWYYLPGYNSRRDCEPRRSRGWSFGGGSSGTSSRGGYGWR